MTERVTSVGPSALVPLCSPPCAPSAGQAPDVCGWHRPHWALSWWGYRSRPDHLVTWCWQNYSELLKTVDFNPASHHPLCLHGWHCGVLQLPGPLLDWLLDPYITDNIFIIHDTITFIFLDSFCMYFTLSFSMCIVSLKYFFWPLYGFIGQREMSQRCQQTGGEREGRREAKGPGRNRTPGRWNEAKASVHGTPALQTELNGAPFSV